MGFIALILVVLAILAVFGFAILYVAIVGTLFAMGLASLIVFAVLYAILGAENAGIALLLAIPAGIGMVVAIGRSVGTSTERT